RTRKATKMARTMEVRSRRIANLQPFEDRPDQVLRHPNGPQRLAGLHRSVVVRAAGEHLAAEARNARVRLPRGLVDFGMKDLHAVDALVEEVRDDALAVAIERGVGDGGHAAGLA